jgi:hypothetical protein
MRKTQMNYQMKILVPKVEDMIKIVVAVQTGPYINDYHGIIELQVCVSRERQVLRVSSQHVIP